MACRAMVRTREFQTMSPGCAEVFCPVHPINGLIDGVAYVTRPPSGTRGQRPPGCLIEVEGMGPKDDWTPTGGGFDQVLAAKTLKAATQKRDIAHRVIQREFSHGIAEPDVGVQRFVAPLTAARHRESRGSELVGQLFSPLRVAGHNKNLATKRGRRHP